MAEYQRIFFQHLPSTNDFAKGNLKQLEDKTVVVTGRQTAGRGRFDRRWISKDSRNIYLSIVLKPKFLDDSIIVNFSQYLSVIVCRVLESIGVNAELKWPNDIFLEGKKVGGILSETVYRGEVLKGIVLGLGLNLWLDKSDLGKIDQPATSINTFIQDIGTEKIERIIIKKEELEQRILDEFFKDYDEFIIQGFKFIAKEYIENFTFLGREITVQCPQGVKHGVVKRIAEDGSLEILTKENSIEKIYNGELLS